MAPPEAAACVQHYPHYCGLALGNTRSRTRPWVSSGSSQGSRVAPPLRDIKYWSSAHTAAAALARCGRSDMEEAPDSRRRERKSQ